MENSWYYLRDGEAHGPFPYAVLKVMARKGDLFATDQLREGTTGEWRLATDFPDLFVTVEPRSVFLDSSSLKGLTMALGIEPAKPGHDPLLGCDIGGVRIVRLIAEGGMGRVYEGKQEKPNRTVAVKVMRPGLASPSVLKRFEYEAEVLGRLQHPGIAHIYSVGVHRMGNATVPYFVMEYIADARTLTQYAEDLKLPTRQRLDLFRSVCDAVAHGHQKGVIHRDLKPSNILVDASGQPKVIDFGVARATDSDMALTTMQTDVGQLIGTLQYMSPEQFNADPNDIDIRSDVYALGVILYELLTGKPPYDVKKKAIYEVMRIVKEEDPTPLSSLNRALRGDVAVIAGKCLEKDRGRRYSSASELGSDVGRHLAGEAISASPPGFVDGLIRLARKHRAATASMVGVIVALVLAVIGISAFAKRAEEARKQAETNEQEARRQAERAESQTHLATEQRNRAVAQEQEARRQKEVANAERARAIQETANAKKQLYVAQVFRVAAMLESDKAPPPPPSLINSLVALAESRRPALEVNCLKAQCDGALLIVHEATCFALSADNRVLATGHKDGTVRLWETAMGTEKATLTGHRGPVRDIAFHGTDRLASVSEDGFMRLWTRAKGGAHTSVEAPAGKPTAVAFAPDGTLLATAGVDRTVSLWHGLTGERRKLVEIGFEAGMLMFSSDGTRMCIGPSYVHGQVGGKGVSVLDLEGAAEPVAMSVDVGVTCVAISPDGQHVAVSNRGNYTEIFDASTGVPEHRLSGHRGEVNTVAYSPDGDFLVTGGNDGQAVVWDAKRAAAIMTLAVDPLYVLAATFSSDGSRVATGGEGGNVKVWDSKTGRCVSLLRGASSRVTKVHSGDNRSGVMSYSSDGCVRLWGTEQQPYLGACSHPTRHGAIALSPDGTTIAISGERGVTIWDGDTCLKIAAVGDPGPSSDSLAFSPDGTKVLSGGSDGKIRVWDRLTGKQDLELSAHARHLAVAWSKSADRIAAAGTDGAIRQWNVPSGSETPPLIPENGTIDGYGSNSNCVCYSPDGRFVASSSDARGLLMWEVATRRSLWSPADEPSRGPRGQPTAGRRGPYRAICFTADGSALAGAGFGSIDFWDVRTGRRTRHFIPGATVTSLVFGGTPGRIVTGGLDGTVRLLDPSDGAELAVLRGHSGFVSGVACSLDGAMLASSSPDGTLRFWGRSNAEIFTNRQRYREAEQRLDNRITAWLQDGPDAAAAKLKEAQTILSPEEYRVAGNMILSRCTAGASKRSGHSRFLTPEQAQLVENVRSGKLKFESLTTLSPEMARSLARYPGALNLNGLTTLSPEAAQELAAYEGTYIRLNGLTILDPETAKALSRCKCTILALGGLASLSPEAAQAFAEFKGTLQLDGVATLSAEDAQTLTGLKGGLSLEKIKTLSPEAARVIVAFQGRSLSFGGLETLAPETAQTLSGFRGDWLGLDGLTTLSPEAAQAIAEFKGRLWLGRVGELSDGAVQALKGFKGKVLFLEQYDTKFPESARSILSKNSRIDLE